MVATALGFLEKESPGSRFRETNSGKAGEVVFGGAGRWGVRGRIQGGRRCNRKPGRVCQPLRDTGSCLSCWHQGGHAVVSRGSQVLDCEL